MSSNKTRKYLWLVLNTELKKALNHNLFKKTFDFRAMEQEVLKYKLFSGYGLQNYITPAAIY